MVSNLGGGNSKISLFSPLLMGNDPHLTCAYFSKGLVKNHQRVEGSGRDSPDRRVGSNFESGWRKPEKTMPKQRISAWKGKDNKDRVIKSFFFCYLDPILLIDLVNIHADDAQMIVLNLIV